MVRPVSPGRRLRGIIAAITAAALGVLLCIAIREGSARDILLIPCLRVLAHLVVKAIDG